MELLIYWQTEKGNFVNKDEPGKSTKQKVGHKPSNMGQHIVLQMPDRLCLKWKKQLESLVNHQFRKDNRAIVYVRSIRSLPFSLSARNAKDFSNNLANLILFEQKGSKLSVKNTTINNII